MLIISVDLFACGFAYGANKVVVPFPKIVVINIIGKILVGGGLVTGHFLGGLMPDSVAIWVGFAILFSLGAVKTLQWFRTRLKKQPNHTKNRTISWRESVLLGVLLSFDGLAAGIGATVSQMSVTFIVLVLGIALVMDQLVFTGAHFLGRKISKKDSHDLGYLSGLILMVVAVTKLLVELFA